MSATKVEVTEAEFNAFIAETKPPFSSVAHFAQPPVIYYCTDPANALESIVATITLWESFPKDGPPLYQWRPNKFYLLKDAP